MSKLIGIRHEDKYVMERRVAITPKDLEKLKAQGLSFQVQTSPKRIFSDAEFEKAGAQIVENLDDAQVIFGVKEMPADFFETGKTYVFFSHVIKGQAYNMPMLKALINKKSQLIDYEKIESDEGRRLIFFGKYAGLAGMINSLWSLGQRLQSQGVETPFGGIRQACTYDSLEEAKAAISAAGQAIAREGLPSGLAPLVIGFTGYGNVSIGAQEIANLLPSIEITPDQLLQLDENQAAGNVIYKVVFREEHLSEPLNASAEFDLQHYYAHPEAYKNQFEKYIPKLSVLMNCMYWDDRYPRIVTKDYLEQLFRNGEPKLKVIGDVTCDPDGSIECTHKGTEIEDPVFVYNPFERKPYMGFEGEGVLVMAVDILPSELPRESSETFSKALFPFVKAIADTDFSKDFNALQLPSPIKKALIVHQGKLTPDYTYIEKYL